MAEVTLQLITRKNTGEDNADLLRPSTHIHPTLPALIQTMLHSI